MNDYIAKPVSIEQLLSFLLKYQKEENIQV